MSYILDALRKADAERERGNVPGIHAQPMFAGAPQSAQRAASRPWFFALAAAALVLLVIIAALIWKMSAGTTGAGPTTSAGSVAAPGNVPVPPVSTPPTAIAAAPLPVSPATPQPPQEAAPAPRKLAKAQPSTAAPAASATGTMPANAALPTLPPTPSASAGEPRVYTYAELPDDIRRQVPAMTVGGSVYSPVPANRFIFVNGQVLHEGDVVAPGVVLQQIRMKAAVLTVGGYRYLMNF